MNRNVNTIDLQVGSSLIAVIPKNDNTTGELSSFLADVVYLPKTVVKYRGNAFTIIRVQKTGDPSTPYEYKVEAEGTKT